jgi:formate-dependent nitrite reductase membrane component NrfD
MDLSSLANESYKKRRDSSTHGTAVLDPRDAYRDVPILKKPVWNHEIAAYFFLGGVSAGSAVIGSLAEVFGGEQHKKLAHAAHYVSFATFLPCPPLLIDDLGMPSRFLHMLRVFKPSSPMNLGAWTFAVHGAGATLTVMRMLAADGKLPVFGSVLRFLPERLLAGLGLPSSLLLAGYSGVLLGTTSIPVWHQSQLLGGLFTASAFSTGAAAVNLLSNVTERDGDQDILAPISLAAGAVELALLAGYFATSGRAAQPYREGLPGKLMGSAVAVMLLSAALRVASLGARKRGRTLLGAVSSIATLAGGALLRWAVIKAGRSSAADREGTLHAMRPRKSVPGWEPTGSQPAPPAGA